MAFHGGYSFKHFEGKAEPVLRALPVPEKAYISFCKGTLISVSPLVKQGDSIRAGEKLFEHGDGSPKCVFPAPVGGNVATIDDSGITITPDSSESFESVAGHTRNPWHLNHGELFGLICSSGCSLLFDHWFDTPDMCGSVRHVIVNTVHNGPLDQGWSPEMFADTTLFPGGLKILKALFPQAETVITVTGKTARFFSAPDIRENAKIITLSDKYPQEHPELLARDAAHMRLVSPEGVRDRSITIMPFVNVIQLAEALTQGRPLIDRILMVAGPGVSRPGWYRIRIGMTFEEIQRRLLKSDEKESWRIVRGNLFEGEGISSPGTSSVRPTDKEISVIRERAVRELWRFMNPGFNLDSFPKVTMADYIPLLPKQLDSNVHGGVRPCVQCNYCDEVCPVNIYPFLIWKYVEAGKTEESYRFKPCDCIGCGLCDYVCPSKIAISAVVTKAKHEYRESRRSNELPH
ncbi:4Fe-4S dicluster domain-containing protein [bacterium]|nr:4Fe-4S dicluster domain-containing protein [bacterium]